MVEDDVCRKSWNHIKGKPAAINTFFSWRETYELVYLLFSQNLELRSFDFWTRNGIYWVSLHHPFTAGCTGADPCRQPAVPERVVLALRN